MAIKTYKILRNAVAAGTVGVIIGAGVSGTTELGLAFGTIAALAAGAITDARSYRPKRVVSTKSNATEYVQNRLKCDLA